MLNIKNLHLEQFKYIRDFQLEQVQTILNRTDLEILEIIVSEENELNNIQIRVKYNNLYNSFNLSGMKLFIERELILNEEDNLKEYILEDILTNEKVLYRSEFVLKKIQEENEYIEKLYEDFTKFITTKYILLESSVNKKMKELWETLNNNQRVKIYKFLNENYNKKLNSYLDNRMAFSNDNYIPFNYPIIIDGLKYGYSLVFDILSNNRYNVDNSSIILIPVQFISSKLEIKPIENIDKLNRWREAIVDLLDLVKKIESINGFAEYKDFYYSNLKYKVLSISMNNDENNPYEDYLKIKDILRNILIF